MVSTPAAFVPVNVPPTQPAVVLKNTFAGGGLWRVIWKPETAGRTSLNSTPVTGPPEKLLIATSNRVH